MVLEEWGKPVDLAEIESKNDSLYKELSDRLDIITNKFASHIERVSSVSPSIMTAVSYGKSGKTFGKDLYSFVWGPHCESEVYIARQKEDGLFLLGPVHLHAPTKQYTHWPYHDITAEIEEAREYRVTQEGIEELSVCAQEGITLNLLDDSNRPTIFPIGKEGVEKYLTGEISLNPSKTN